MAEKEDEVSCPIGFIHFYGPSSGDVWAERGCNQTHCSRCWNRRMQRSRGSIRAQIAEWSGWPFLLTRSLPNNPSMLDGLNELAAAMQRFRVYSYREKNHPWHIVEDWVGVLEIKIGNGGWNIHEHWLCELPEDFVDFGPWHPAWRKAAMLKHAHLNWTKVEHDAVTYLSKYMTKGLWGGLTEAQAKAHKFELKGRRHLRRKRGSAPKIPATDLKRCCEVGDHGQCLDDDWFRILRARNTPQK